MVCALSAWPLFEIATPSEDEPDEHALTSKKPHIVQPYTFLKVMESSCLVLLGKADGTNGNA
jgi:hypothetical protein